MNCCKSGLESLIDEPAFELGAKEEHASILGGNGRTSSLTGTECES